MARRKIEAATPAFTPLKEYEYVENAPRKTKYAALVFCGNNFLQAKNVHPK